MLDISGTGAKLTAQSTASRNFPTEFFCKYANPVLDGDSGELLEYRHLIKYPNHKEIWGTSFGNKVERLTQGMLNRVSPEEATDTLFFIKESKVPHDRSKDVTYQRIVCNYRDHKVEKPMTSLTVGGDRINYPFDCGTPTAYLLKIKPLLNSVISTPGAKFMTLDIKHFYLNTPMPRCKYFRMKLLELFPDDVIDKYNICDKVEPDGYVYAKTRKGMYDLPQAGYLLMSYLPSALSSTATSKERSPQGFGRTIGAPPSAFPLILTTLV